ncbi:TasA family protein [Oceanobacillus bengalensis]|uniref:Cell division protein FtsN n=1 Tax=Oceanobacillus bengalensis TaxID=1435466 RepID=A0A494Z6L3_9BACI|nr:TasA family protein [Oceanobacillus bengalensis]RKQ18201.1 cell division protein FtsN [Oceanobacillus bengalensis]
MSWKKNIAMGMATGLIGMALVSGGTVAYFSDTEVTTNKIVSGTLDLGVTEVNDEGILFEFENKMPGDTFDYTFQLSNDGSLEIGDVKLISNYKVNDEEASENDFGSQIIIKALKVNDTSVLEENENITLYDIVDNPTVLIENFGADKNIDVYVEFEFMKTNEKQNQYQGNSLELVWTFEAMQTDN